MNKYLIRYKLKNSVILDDCIIYAKNKSFAKIKFLKATKHLYFRPYIYFIQEFKNENNS